MTRGDSWETPGMRRLGLSTTFPAGLRLRWMPFAMDGKPMLICPPEGGPSGLFERSGVVFPHLAVVALATLGREDMDELRRIFGAPSELGYAWPDHTCVLQCPVCRRRASPDDDEGERRETYVLVAHNVAQAAAAPGLPIGQRLLYRLCCPGCFAALVPDSAGPLCELAGDAQAQAGPCTAAVLEFEQSGKARAYKEHFRELMTRWVLPSLRDAAPRPKGALAAAATLAGVVLAVMAFVGLVAYLPLALRGG